MASYWTPLQLERIMIYGKCRLCGAPGLMERTLEEKDGKIVATQRMVCENGHTGY